MTWQRPARPSWPCLWETQGGPVPKEGGWVRREARENSGMEPGGLWKSSMGTGAWPHHSFIHSTVPGVGGCSMPGTGQTLGKNQADVVIPQRSIWCSNGRDTTITRCKVRAAAKPLLPPEPQLLVSRMDTPLPTSWAGGLVE